MRDVRDMEDEGMMRGYGSGRMKTKEGGMKEEVI